MSPVPRKIRSNNTTTLNGDYSNETVKSIDNLKKNGSKSKSQNTFKRKLTSRLSSIKDDEYDLDDVNLYSVKGHFFLDRINIKIINELISNGDIKSSEISEKLKIPLSTIQRRRTRIEKTVLKKKYQMDLIQLGYRTAQIFVDVQKGKAQETGEELLKKYNRNVINASTRINSSNNLCLEVVYHASDELHNLLEEVKSMPLVKNVDWSEQVMMIGDNMSTIIRNTLANRLKQTQSSKMLV